MPKAVSISSSLAKVQRPTCGRNDPFFLRVCCRAVNRGYNSPLGCGIGAKYGRLPSARNVRSCSRWSLEHLVAADALLPVSNPKTQLMPSPGSPPLGTHELLLALTALTKGQEGRERRSLTSRNVKPSRPTTVYTLSCHSIDT